MHITNTSKKTQKTLGESNMTDKVMIDGVNVSGCLNFDKSDKIHCCDFPYDKCEGVPNCLYKQLRRKEQECEELRQYHNKCCEEHKKEIEEWLKKYNQVARDFFNGMYCDKEHCNLVKTKEQENKDLTYQYINAKDDAENYKKSAEERLELLNALNDDYKRLRAENEELKIEIENWNAANIEIAIDRDRYRQALNTIQNIYDEMDEIYLLDNDILTITNEVLND